MLNDRQLDRRKSAILKAVVTDYVMTAEPIGSQYLAERYSFGIKPASIRNELAEMSEMGYLRQPHTSAGRIPSDLGYRFYVDRLMEPMTLSASQAHRAISNLEAQHAEIEDILAHSLRILSGLTHYASVGTRPSLHETTVRLVNLSRLAKDKLLFVLALSNGSVEHRILDLRDPLTDTETIRLGNILSSRVVGRTLQDLTAVVQDLPEGVPSQEAYKAALVCIREIAHSAAEDEVYIEGTSNILKQPEFKDVDRLERLLRALEERKALFRLLSAALLGPGTTVVIGSENPYAAMQDTSLVTATYSIGKRVCGTIGVVGPTRMDYRQAAAAVSFMARSLSELLTSLGVE